MKHARSCLLIAFSWAITQSSLARYVQSDPVGLAAGTNTYTYADNDPLRYVDPNGLCPCGESLDVLQLARTDRRDWSKAADRSDINRAFGPGTYKCNLFADEQFETAGYHLPNMGGSVLARALEMSASHRPTADPFQLRRMG